MVNLEPIHHLLNKIIEEISPSITNQDPGTLKSRDDILIHKQGDIGGGIYFTALVSTHLVKYSVAITMYAIHFEE